MAKQYDLHVKLLLIGDSGVGKTCMICRFADESFSLKHNTTIGIDFMIKSVVIGGKKVRIQLWDTAGQERYDTLTKQYYRRAHGILLVYDITNHKTFEHLEKWVEYVRQHANDDVELSLVANKCDMDDSRKVYPHQGRQLAGNLGIPFYEASAKDDKNIEMAFLDMTKKVMIQHKREFDRIRIERCDSDLVDILKEEDGKCDEPCCSS